MDTKMTLLTQIRDKVSKMTSGDPSVVGVGIELGDDGKPVVAVHLSSDQRPADLPSEIDGQPLKFSVTGKFAAY
jgi:hypothetical protein